MSCSGSNVILEERHFDLEMLSGINQVLGRHFLKSVFIAVDVAVHNEKLYCDSLCDHGILLPGQVLKYKYCIEYGEILDLKKENEDIVRVGALQINDHVFYICFADTANSRM